jgi:hypothetical protein
MKMKKLMMWTLVITFAASVSAQMKSTIEIKGDGVGYVLLNDVIKLFEEIAPSGGSFQEKILQGLDRLFREVRVAREQKYVDASFFERYKRILVVLKLVILKSERGKGGSDPILDTVIVREVNQFDDPVKMSEGDAIQGIGTVAGTVATELLSLKRHLDKVKGQRVQ